MNPKRLTLGNSKLKNMMIFDLPTGKSCPNCKECYKTCYAKKAEIQYKAVLPFRNQNFHLAKYENETLEILLRKQLDKTRKTTLRIHSAGDFFSQDYVDFWVKIVKLYPHIKFYAYTKTTTIFDFSELTSLDNFNLIPSFIEGNLNYGSVEYIEGLVEKYDAFICPATVDKKIKCNEGCTYCVENNKVVFKIH